MPRIMARKEDPFFSCEYKQLIRTLLANRVIYSAISNIKFKNSYLDPSGVFESEDSAFFFSGGSTECISGAPEGRYGACTQVDGCWSCVVDVNLLCPPGTFASAPGTTSQDHCISCPRGRFSAGGASECQQSQV